MIFHCVVPKGLRIPFRQTMVRKVGVLHSGVQFCVSEWLSMGVGKDTLKRTNNTTT